jgi:hypothetical protein
MMEDRGWKMEGGGWKMEGWGGSQAEDSGPALVRSVFVGGTSDDSSSMPHVR